MFLSVLVVYLPFVCLNAQGHLTYTTISFPYDYLLRDINDHGEIVGEYRNVGGRYGFYFLADGSRATTDLGTGRNSSSTLHAINNHHFAVGMNQNHLAEPGLNGPRAARFHSDFISNPRFYLGSLVSPGGDALAYGINDSNLVVGDSMTVEGTRHAVRFELDGTVTDLGTLGGSNSVALDINARGDIIGQSEDHLGRWRSFVIPAGGVMTDLGDLGGGETFAQAINRYGDVVGWSKNADGDKRAFLFFNGQITDLGTLAGGNSHAFDIDDHGVIVGDSTKENAYVAFIKYPNMPMRELEDFAHIPKPDPYSSAVAINNHGEILVQGAVGAQYISPSYLLRPGHVSIGIPNRLPQIRFNVPPGTRARLDISSDLTSWTSLHTNTVTETTMLFHPIADEPRFYRAMVVRSAE